MNRLRTWTWRGAVLMTAGWVFVPSASAFYFKGWPAGPKDPPTVLPTNGPPPFSQGKAPPKGTSDPGDPSGGDPGGGNPGGNNPPPTHSAPEPGTAALAAVGLGAAVVLRRGRRGKAPRA